MIHESKDRGVLTIDLFVGFAAMVLMTYVILHPERLGHLPTEKAAAEKNTSPPTVRPNIAPELTNEQPRRRARPRLQLASLAQGTTETESSEAFYPVESPEDDFSAYNVPDPMLKESFYDHIQTQRYLLSNQKHARTTVQMRKFLHNWGLSVSAIPEAVDLAWENLVTQKALEKEGEESEPYRNAVQRFELSKTRFSANHGIDNHLFWKDLLKIEPLAPFGEVAIGIMANNVQ